MNKSYVSLANQILSLLSDSTDTEHIVFKEIAK